ncbi:hypothetical protein Aduo_008968 [Ancylostoma duodenale]
MRGLGRREEIPPIARGEPRGNGRSQDLGQALEVPQLSRLLSGERGTAFRSNGKSIGERAFLKKPANKSGGRKHGRRNTVISLGNDQPELVPSK